MPASVQHQELSATVRFPTSIATYHRRIFKHPTNPSRIVYIPSCPSPPPHHLINKPVPPPLSKVAPEVEGMQATTEHEVGNSSWNDVKRIQEVYLGF
ncbi:hypothetical protein L2E82_50342 [Cichorium intybus]|nr:hypothetical protein L2E82_50342 [Cichorium intybus]